MYARDFHNCTHVCSNNRALMYSLPTNSLCAGVVILKSSTHTSHTCPIHSGHQSLCLFTHVDTIHCSLWAAKQGKSERAMMQWSKAASISAPISSTPPTEALLYWKLWTRIWSWSTICSSTAEIWPVVSWLAMTGIWQNKDFSSDQYDFGSALLELNINFYVLGVGWSLPNGNWMVALNWQFDPNWSSNPSIISKSNPIQWISKYCLAHFKCLPSKEKLYVKPNVSVFTLNVLNASHLCNFFCNFSFPNWIYTLYTV